MTAGLGARVGRVVRGPAPTMGVPVMFIAANSAAPALRHLVQPGLSTPMVLATPASHAPLAPPAPLVHWLAPVLHPARRPPLRPWALPPISAHCRRYSPAPAPQPTAKLAPWSTRALLTFAPRPVCRWAAVPAVRAAAARQQWPSTLAPAGGSSVGHPV